jgi:ubiquitin carboxyl-terminal hydrolase 8
MINKMFKGLANIGNTCSINTLVQCIGHCPSFLEFILKTDIQVTKIDNRKYSVYIELKEILKHLWVDDTSMIPRRFIEAFYESIGDSYTIGEQFDFTEMWMLLLNNIIHETHSDTHVSKYQICKSESDILQKKVQDSLSLFFKNSNSPLNELFQGSHIQQITCEQCTHKSHLVEPLAISYIDNPNIFEGLQDILETQQIKEWKCEKCSYHTGTKFIRFWKLPNIWMIVLQRYNSNSKTTMPIDIPPIIPLNSNVEMSSGTNNNVHYELRSIANHYGSLDGGHYTAVCKNNNGVWCEYNDLKIAIIIDINLLLKNNRIAYALFYERVCC